jgi:hypothetical protein
MKTNLIFIILALLYVNCQRDNLYFKSGGVITTTYSGTTCQKGTELQSTLSGVGYCQTPTPLAGSYKATCDGTTHTLLFYPLGNCNGITAPTSINTLGCHIVNTTLSEEGLF